jgi:hypothetical protein
LLLQLDYTTYIKKDRAPKLNARLLPAPVADGDLRSQGNCGTGAEKAAGAAGMVPADTNLAIVGAPVHTRNIAAGIARTRTQGGVFHI